MKSRILKILTVVVSFFFIAGNAWATPTLKIWDDDSSLVNPDVTVVDSDNDGLLSYSYMGQIGVFDLTMSVGITKPHDGSASFPIMHFSGATTTDNSGTLTFAFSETDFGPLESGITGFISSMNGAGGIQSLKVYYDTNNDLFGTGQLIADLDTLNTYEIFNGIPSSNPFSLTMIATITLNNGSGSFDNTVNPVPEPATMLLFGTGLLCLAFIGRKRFEM